MNPPIRPEHQALLVHANAEKLFELTPGTLPFFAHPDRTPLPIKEMYKRIKEYRTILKKARRRLVMKYHPDRTGDDTQMKKINDAYDFLRNMIHEKNVRPARPPQPRVHVQFYYSYTAGGDGATTTSSNYYGAW